MSSTHSFRPDWFSAPGETIVDILREKKLSNSKFASEMRCSPEVIDGLLDGTTPITNEIAYQLALVLGGTERFWLCREDQYRADFARIRASAEKEELVDWLSELPWRDMVKFRWITAKPDKEQQSQECLRFFGVPSVSAWRSQYRAISDAVAFRTSEHFESIPGSVTAWLRQGEVQAQNSNCAPWDREKLVSLMETFRSLTRKKEPTTFIPILKELCSDCGVVVAIVRSPAGCRASGATKFVSQNKALLMLSFRYRTDDHFWFTFFHEIAHLILHGKTAFFVEGANMITTHEEVEANHFAANALLPQQFFDEIFSLRKDFRTIMRFARKVGVSPGIIVGQMQHNGLLARNQMNFLKTRYVWAD